MELLLFINPTIAAIGGELPSRRYGNPDITVMERLSAVGATIFSTCRFGDVTMMFGEDGIKLSQPDSERLTVGNCSEAT